MKVNKPLQRDMDLVRQILLAIEASPEPTLETQPTIKDWSDKQVMYHLELLREAGLIKVAHTFQGDKATVVLGIRLTWTGHEFLAVARKDTRWNKVKAKLGGTFSEVTLSILKSELARIVIDSLGP